MRSLSLFKETVKKKLPEALSVKLATIVRKNCIYAGRGLNKQSLDTTECNKNACTHHVTLKSSQSSVISSDYKLPIEVWPSSMNLIFHASPVSELWDFSTRNSLIFSTHR